MSKALYKLMRDGDQTTGFYETKAEARADRDNLNRAADKNGGGVWVICRGPDHRLGESFNKNLNPTPSSKKVEIW